MGEVPNMKKRSLFVIILLFSSLTGCNSYKVPTNNYEKVKTAFNGVEKSFKKISSKKSLIQNSGLSPRYKNMDNGLSSLFGFFTSDDIKGHTVEDLSYNEPPMIQFQYLKAVFDKVGEGYQFGTKYYDNITGDIYVDFATGFKDETKKAENKYGYNFELAIDIDIDSNSLINADVSFDINLTKASDNSHYYTKWYVNLLLDYNMEESSPNYTLAMYTENDEITLPYYDRFTYEYDYVDVKDNKIDEWQKFCMHSSLRLIKDSNHSSFTDYIDKDQITYKVDYPKWFKNNNYYKLTQMSNNRQREVGNILFNDLGLNANDINADVFFNKAKTNNAVLKEMYNKFTEIAKEEIIYDLVCRDEDDAEQNQVDQIAGIRAMFADGQTGADNISVSNSTKLSDLFTASAGNNKIDLWYCSENLGLIEKIDNYNVLTYRFTTDVDGRQNEVYTPVDISTNDTIKEAYNKLHQLNNFTVYSRQIHILIKDNPPSNYEGVLNLRFDDEFEFENTNPVFPEDLSKLGVPEYDGERLSFEYTRDGENYSLRITGSTGSERERYLEKLTKAGFERDWYNSNYSLYAPVFKKSFDDQQYLLLQLDYNKEDYILLKVWREQKPHDEGNEGSEEQQNVLQINSLVIVGLNGDWEIQNGLPLQGSNGSFSLSNITFTQGTMFKLVANGDWTIHSADTAYGGFGFDDIEDLDSKGQECIERLEGSDGNIVAKRTFEVSIGAFVQGNVLRINFKGFRY